MPLQQERILSIRAEYVSGTKFHIPVSLQIFIYDGNLPESRYVPTETTNVHLQSRLSIYRVRAMPAPWHQLTWQQFYTDVYVSINRYVEEGNVYIHPFVS